MKRYYHSLLQRPAPGFSAGPLDKRSMLTGLLVLQAKNRKAALEFLAENRNRVSGLILTPGPTLKLTKIRPSLWHLRYTRENSANARELGDSFLEGLEEVHGLLQVRDSLRVDLARTRADEENTRSSLNESTRRLAEIISDLRSEIAQREAADSARLQSEEKYHAIFESTTDALFIHDATGHILEVNHTVLEMFQYSETEVQGLTIGDFSEGKPPYSQVEAEQKVQLAYHEGPQLFRWRSRRKDGSLFWTEVGLRMTLIAGEERVIAAVRDITQQVESRKMLDTVLDTIPVRVFWKDRDSIFLGCNQAFAADAGLKNPRDVLGRTDFEMGWKDQAELYRRDDRKVMETRIPKINYEEPQTTPEGRQIWLRTSKIPLCDENGKVYGVLGTYEDITEEKKAQEQIQQDLAEKRVLLQEIHHRVKNNLNIIVSLLNLQANKVLDRERALTAFEESRDRVYTMALVHDMLYRSDNLSEIGMRDYVRNMAIRLLQSHAVGKAIDLRMDVGNVSLDINRAIPLGLILNELVTNVCKHAFRNRQQGILEISLRRGKDRKGYRLRIHDDGTGLPPGVDAQSTDTLGLHLVSLLTDQLNGSLKIRRDRGTTFFIDIPE